MARINRGAGAVRVQLQPPRAAELPVFAEKISGKENRPAHRHKGFFELLAVFSGACRLVVGSDEYLIKKGDLVVVKAGLEHGIEDPCELKAASLHYKKETLNGWIQELPEPPGSWRFFTEGSFIGKKPEFREGFHLSPSGLQYLEWLVDRIIAEGEGTDRASPARRKAYFLALAAFVAGQEKRLDLNAAVRTRAGDLQLREVVKYITEHYAEPIKVSQLAEMTYLSPRHFTRIFKEYFQTTPMNFITNCRLQRARQLLAEKNHSITQVANECGFSDSNYFARQFKKAFGVSPSEYRTRVAKRR
ncbi:MAG: AraC family transcriptional regulator [Firmicutes bacterium]|nr:AraC family transcriptional regulator [Bacillota bacterium]